MKAHTSHIKTVCTLATALILSACDAVQLVNPPQMGAAIEGNLLTQGSFDDSFGTWTSCGDPALINRIENEQQGTAVAQLQPNACMYQMVSAQENDNMQVSCEARKTDGQVNSWTSMTFGYLDENFDPLKTVEKQIASGNFDRVSAALRAPVDARYAEVLIYTESGAEIDDCEIVNTQAGLPAEILQNPYFEEGIEGWAQCSGGTVDVDNNVATVTGTCIQQKFNATAGLNLTMSCDAVKLDNIGYAAIAVGFLDSNDQPLGTEEVPLTVFSTVAPSISATAPAGASFAQVIVYSQNSTEVKSCSLTKTQPATM